MVFEERNDRYDARGRDVDCELIFPDGKLLDIFWKAREEVLPVIVKPLGLLLILVGRVYDWDMKFSAS